MALPRVVAFEVGAGDPEPGVDDVFVFAELLRLRGFFERGRGVVVLLLGVGDAAEVGLGVEVVVGILLDVFQHLLVVRRGALVIAGVEVDRAAEEQRVAEKVRVEERLIGVEELQRFLEQMQRVVAVAEGVGIERLQRQRLRGHVVVLRIAQRLLVQLLRLRVVVRLVREMAEDDVRLVLDVVRLVGLLGGARCRESVARAGDVAGVERGHGAVVRRFEIRQDAAALRSELLDELRDELGQDAIVRGRVDDEVVQVDQAVFEDAHQLEHQRDALRLVATSA